ncbi:protein-glutamate O-methyltransferase [Cupriavidus oxalaticus]|uniref:CheR family methyltransferase n=1 Tax=Cupriavidus oxalaticus TaxID=96344 RepID=UPI003F734297
METQRIDDRTTDVPIVAIGSSAGGITALQKLFESLRPDIPASFVVLQHLPPGQPSQLPALVGGWTAMPVLCATDGVQPAIAHVYVPLPEHILTLEDGVFRTRPAEGGQRRPGIDTIDAFLETLSRRKHPRSIAVILSGTGMDGTAGTVGLRQAGGIVIVQDPLTALHDGMPNAVIQRGIHDHILPVGAIGQQLLACLDADYVRPEKSTAWATSIQEALGRILSCVRRQAGFDFSGYKPSPLLWRVQERMDIRRVRTFEDYAYLVEDDPVELEALVRGLPIHVTEFFRDPDAWALLRHDVIQPLVRGATDRPVRVWTPACSTGEEAYSVAMLLEDVARENGTTPNFQIFATDAAPDIVARASRGFFAKERMAAVPPLLLADYFYSMDRGFRIKRFLREKMVFVPQDLIGDPPFSGLDLVTCRNLLIYLEPETVEAVLHLLHAALRMGGYLFLGSSEAHQLQSRGFEPVSTKWKIFRKTGPMQGWRIPPLFPAPTTERAVLSAASHLATIEGYQVPSALIDDECAVLRIYGDTTRFLALRAGEPTLNLLELVPKTWKPLLRSMVAQCLNTRQSITVTDVLDERIGNGYINIRATPIDPAEPGGCIRLLVSFLRNADMPEPIVASNGYVAGAEGPCSTLVEWRDDSRVSREELEASREELQALNEELRSSNTQLNLSNDNLNDANSALQKTVAQLKLQGDVLSAGAVLTLFLDREMRLRWFTPAMRDAMSLVPGDTGRLITDLVPKFNDTRFYDDIHDVLAGADQREAVIRNAGRRWYLRRINPHRTSAGTIAGVAVTFADITDRTIAEHALRDSEISLRRSRDWLSAQKEAFQAAMNGAPLEESLRILIATLVNQADDGRRCAFYIAKGDVLEHVTGMTDAYAKCVNGFRISPESLACGLAVATGKPVITQDVMEEPRWQPWTWLALQFGYRGCWSFPVETATGNLVGSLAMYFEQPRAPTAVDVELAAAFTQTAAIIISRHVS